MTSRLYIKFTPRLRFEPETIAFMTALGIAEDNTVYFTGTAYETTGDDLWDYVDAAVVGLKDIFGLTLGLNNLYTVFGFIYPFVGGTAAMHKYNLVDVAVGVGAFSGGVTHAGSGVQFNGVNGYFDTNYFGGSLTYPTPPGNIDGNNNFFGVYSRTNSSGLMVDLFCADGVNSEVYIYSRTGGGNVLTRNGTTGTNHQTGIPDSLGHTSVTRINNTEYKVFRGGILVDTYAQASNIQFADANVLLGSIAGVSQFTDRELAFAYGSAFSNPGCTPSQMADIDSVIQDFQTALNRAV